MKEVWYLVIAVIVQLILVTVIPVEVLLGVVPAALVSARFVGVRTATLRRTTGALMVLTVPVLIVQLIGEPTWITVRTWGEYALGLIGAAATAAVYLKARGARGVQRALTTLTGGSKTVVVGDMVRSALFLLPDVSRRLRAGRDAARIRFARAGRTGIHHRIAAVSRATVVSVSTVPRRRAEAMVVRGLVRRKEHP